MSTEQPSTTVASEYSGEKLQENLARLMKHFKINMSQLHRQTGVPITTIQRIRTDPHANPTVTNLKPIANFFNISISQLIGDEPLPLTEGQGDHFFRENTAHWKKIPLISWVDAPTWGTASEPEHAIIEVDIDVSNQSFALVVEEENWNNFPKESILVIDPNLKIENRDFIITQIANQSSCSLKQVLFYENGQYLKPVEPNFPVTPFTKEYRVIGVVAQIKFNARKN